MSNQLIIASRSGDEAAFSELSKEYAPLIESMVVKYLRLTEGFALEKDDLRQEASVAFFRAVMTYDLFQKDVSFGLYAKICIRNRLVSVARSLRKKARYKELKSQAVHQRLNEMPYEKNELLLNAENLLSKKELKVFLMYADGQSYKEISCQLGISEKSVDNALFRAKTKLRSLKHY